GRATTRGGEARELGLGVGLWAFGAGALDRSIASHPDAAELAVRLGLLFFGVRSSVGIALARWLDDVALRRGRLGRHRRARSACGCEDERKEDRKTERNNGPHGASTYLSGGREALLLLCSV